MWLLKASLPGSVPFLLIALAVGLTLLHWRRTQLWGRRCLQSLLALYTLLSMPAGSGAIAAPLSWGYSPLTSATDARDASAVVVLDGGTTRCAMNGRILDSANEATTLRALETLRVSVLLGDPLVIVTGGLETPVPGWSVEGEALRQELLRGGIPPGRVVLDPVSKNTRAHAKTVTKLLRERGISRFVLVTSATHIRRATAAFRFEGADPIPSPAPLQCDSNQRGWRAFWPTASALEASEAGVYDYLGILYYWSRGWI